VALVAREYAKAWMTVRLGDRTPRLHGRLTLNPRRHVEPFGTIILPALTLLPVLFGRLFFPVFAYAKPQEINRWSLRRRDRSVVMVALTGPVTNLILAVAVGLAMRSSCSPGQLTNLLVAGLEVNIVMAVLHLIPLPPFDAALILRQFLKGRAGQVYESWQELGVLFVLVIFFLLAGPVFGFLGAVGDGIRDTIVGSGCGGPLFPR
jgi:Zn-dependent protease